VLDRAAVQEIEAALRNKQAASALAEVVTGEHPEFGLVVLVKTGEGTVLSKDGERFRGGRDPRSFPWNSRARSI
jgi:hypothetical protein